MKTVVDSAEIGEIVPDIFEVLSLLESAPDGKFMIAELPTAIRDPDLLITCVSRGYAHALRETQTRGPIVWRWNDGMKHVQRYPGGGLSWRRITCLRQLGEALKTHHEHVAMSITDHGLAALTEWRLAKSVHVSIVEAANITNEWTLAEAAMKFDIPKSAWTKATRRKPTEYLFLPHKRIGRNVYVQPTDAKAFADAYLAKREQRTVGTTSRNPDRQIVVSALKQLKKHSPKANRPK